MAVVVVDAGRLAATPAGQLSEVLSWERLLLDKAAAAGSTPVIVYNTKLQGGAGAASAADVAAAGPRLDAALNPEGAYATQQLELAREEVSDVLAGFLQEAAARARQHDVPTCLPQQYLAGERSARGCGGQRGPSRACLLQRMVQGPPCTQRQLQVPFLLLR